MGLRWLFCVRPSKNVEVQRKDLWICPLFLGPCLVPCQEGKWWTPPDWFSPGWEMHGNTNNDPQIWRPNLGMYPLNVIQTCWVSTSGDRLVINNGGFKDVGCAIKMLWWMFLSFFSNQQHSCFDLRRQSCLAIHTPRVSLVDPLQGFQPQNSFGGHFW